MTFPFPSFVSASSGIAISSDVLMHFDGTNGATSTTDERGNTINRVANAQLSTAQKKFGSASFLSDGSAGYWTVAADLHAGTSDFTLSFWLYLAADQTQKGLWSNRRNASSTEWCLKISGTTNCLGFHNGGAAIIDDTTHPLSNTTWTHVALMRASGTVYIFTGGSSIASVADSTNYSGSGSFTIGGFDQYATGIYNGYMDELIYNKSTALYSTSGFTPPTSPYS